MVFGEKCPAYGAKNPKERITCIECGAPLDLGQVKERPTELSPEGKPNLTGKRRNFFESLHTFDKKLQDKAEDFPDESGGRITEQDEQRMVIVPDLSFMWIVSLVVAITIGILLPRPWGIVIAIVVALYSLGKLIGDKVVLDKTTESITLEKRPFLLIHRRRVIPFSRVGLGSVTVERKLRGGEHGGYYWEVSLIYGVPGVGVKKLKIAKGTNEADMQSLADEIRILIGK